MKALVSRDGTSAI